MNKQIDRACKLLQERVGYDKVIDAFASQGYIQITVSIGGDILTYRVYPNNQITER